MHEWSNRIKNLSEARAIDLSSEGLSTFTIPLFKYEDVVKSKLGPGKLADIEPLRINLKLISYLLGPIRENIGGEKDFNDSVRWTFKANRFYKSTILPSCFLF